MKRVRFGYKGGFPLEQETLIQLQKAYEEDVLEAMMAQWGIDPTKRYKIKEAASEQYNWIIAPYRFIEVDPSNGNETQRIKPQLFRLKYLANAAHVQIVDLRATDGFLEYAQANQNNDLNRKVYEDFVAEMVTTANSETFPYASLLELKTTIALSSEIDGVKENYLPRDGSKPMTGSLALGIDKPNLTDGEEGDRLIFRGTGGNTDAVWMSKNTPSQDVTELRVNIGDNATGSSKDSFIIGGSVSGGSPWEEKFRVQTNGRVGIGVSNPEANLDIDATIGTNPGKLKIRNVAQVNSQTALVIDSEGNVGRGTTGVGGFELGMIMMWSGAINEIPTGWALCNGVGGTPNLSGKFIVGYSAGDSDYNTIGNDGGEKTVRLTTSQMPSHTHSGSTNSRGKHFHGFPADDQLQSFTSRYSNELLRYDARSVLNAGDARRLRTTENGDHTHSLNITNAGGGQPHENRPPYYTLAFIVYVGLDFNALPVVSAGNDVAITLPTNSVNLSGSASDPDGNVLSTQWTRVSGGSATIANPNSLSTAVTGLSLGTYVFRLTATDDDNGQVFDTVSVRVIEAAAFIRVVPTSLGSSIPRAGGTYDVTIESNRPWRKGIGIVGVTLSQDSGNGGETIQLTVPRNTGTSPRRGSLQFQHVSGSLNASVGWNQLGATIVPSNISVSPTTIRFRNVGEETSVRVTTNQSWQATSNNSAVLIDPSSGSGSMPVILTLRASGSRSGTITFRAGTGAGSTVSVGWSSSISGGGGSGDPIIVGPDGANCFDIKSDVLLANGKTKKIADIVLGDKLVGLDYPNRIDESQGDYFDWKGALNKGESAEVTVTKIEFIDASSYYQIKLSNRKIIRVTEEHPLLIIEKRNTVIWKRVKDLKENDKIIDKNKNKLGIEYIKVVNKPLKVAILGVENVDNYVVGGIVAHNK